MQRQFTVIITGIAAYCTLLQRDIRVAQINVITFIQVSQIQKIQRCDIFSHLNSGDRCSVVIPGCTGETKISICSRTRIITGIREIALAAQLQCAAIQQIPERIADTDFVVCTVKIVQSNVDTPCAIRPATLCNGNIIQGFQRCAN